MAKKSIFQNIFLLLISFLILFFILEGIFRIVNGLKKTGETWAIYDEDLGYRLRPNFADFNENGLRDRPVMTPKDKFRILLLGDSVPFYGNDIDDTYVGRLETYLNNQPELIPIEVLNCGVKGYTNYQELIYLKKYGLKFKPDLVGVSFVLNDLHKFLHQFEVNDGKIVGETYGFTQKAIQTVESPLYQLARKSELLVWLRHKLTIFDNIVEMQVQDGFTFDFRPDFSTAWQDAPWLDIRKQLEEMKSLGTQNNFKIFLVVFPFGEQLREDYLKRDRDYVTKPQRKLQEICKSLDIYFLDLFDFIDSKKHLIEDQIHLTEAGRQLAAEKIGDFLIHSQLIPIIISESN